MPQQTETTVVDAHAVVDEPTESQALAMIEKTPDTIAIRRDPTLLLAEATKAAAALHDVIEKKPKKVIFNGEQYIENEDWQTIGHFYGITAKIESDSFVQFGNVQGFAATAIALDRAGREVSRAVAMCLNDEENWGPRPKYEWHYVTKSGKVQRDDPGKDDIVWEDSDKPGGKRRPKKQRVHVGDEPTPLFQLRSMAQTRACSRVLRQVLGFVPVLAGYKATPAEELNVERVDRAATTTDVATESTTERRPQSRSQQQQPKNGAQPVVDGEFVDETTKQQTKPSPKDDDDLFTVTALVELKSGTNQNGEWKLYGIETKEIGAKQYVSTLDRAMAKVAFDAKKAGRKVRMQFGTSQKGQYTNRELHEIVATDIAAE